MTLYELEGSNIERNYKGRDGDSLVKLFSHQHPFGLHFRYHHQVNNHNNKHHSPISIKRTWATKFWNNCNFAWYLAMTEVSTALVSGHFPNGGDVMPIFAFWGQLAMQCTENTIGTDTGDIGTPVGGCRRPQILEIQLEKVPNYRGK